MSTSAPTPPGAAQTGSHGPRWRGWLIALISVVAVVVVGAIGVFAWMNSQQSCSKASDPTRAGAVTEYCPSDPYKPTGAMTFGPDGNIWYTDTQGKVARFTPQTGAVTETAAPTSGNTVGYAGLVRGGDGNIWYIANDKLGRVSMSGEFKEFDLPKELGLTRGVAAGTDGTLWVVMTRDDPYLNPTLLKIAIPSDATGTPQIVEAPLPANAIAGPIAAGPDGNLWMATAQTVISRITPAGAITQFPLNIPGPDPYGCGADCKTVFALTAGPDGNMWFVDGWGHIGRMTLAGAATFFRVSGVSQQTSIGAGPDGNVWFSTENGGVGRITPAGSVTKYTLPHMDSGAGGITAGPDGGVWFMLGGYSQPLQTSPRFARITP